MDKTEEARIDAILHGYQLDLVKMLLRHAEQALGEQNYGRVQRHIASARAITEGMNSTVPCGVSELRQKPLSPPATLGEME